MPGTNIGDITFAPDFSRVFLWQYDNAEKLNAILQGEIDFYNREVAGFWQWFLYNAFNIDTADEAGLGMWGALLGVPRITYGENETPVSVEMYRRMLKARFFCFGSRGTLPEINRYLSIVFPGKPIFCRDNYDMTVTFLTYESLSEEEVAVLLSPDFLPIPAGVKSNVYTTAIGEIFGFDGSELQPFDQGVFIY